MKDRITKAVVFNPKNPEEKKMLDFLEEKSFSKFIKKILKEKIDEREKNEQRRKTWNYTRNIKSSKLRCKLQSK